MKDLTMIENELVPVYETSTGEKVVYGSELHEVLNIKSPYREWYSRRFKDCDAIENVDFEAVEISTPSGQKKKQHIIKLDIAKEMAMLERNEKGKRVRRYFIEVEKRYKNVSELPHDSDVYMEAARILAGTPVHTKSEVVNVLRHVVPDISTMEEKPIKKDYSVPFDFNHFDNYLKKYGVTTQVLSMKSDVCAQLIYKYRNGKTVPTMETRKKLTEALGIAENYFNHERGGRRRYS